ncbi:FxSxx-COOH system tetratricopeptide repeat protein [Actinocorallia aurantiaca]|uniref:FxSxx-COOH system tetratricopeptide repeat protein n=1 Tax=Actinocorallia aurantiaca TaxID=46204 RepID=A0ABP6GSF8_9ACTN
MIDELFKALRGLRSPLSAEEIQDALWLVRLMSERPAEARPPQAVEETSPVPPLPAHDASSPPGLEQASPVEQRVRTTQETEAALFLTGRKDITSPRVIRAPAPPALPRSLRLSRALRPLRVHVDSATEFHLDEEKTARRIAETGIWQPLTNPSPERLFDLAIVVDTSASMQVWRRTVEEFQALLEQLGAFRDVRVWRMNTDGHRPLSPTPGSGSGRSPAQLVDPTGRRIVLVVSDCIGGAWQDGRASALLERWGHSGPVAIVQPLPERLWWRCSAPVEHVRFTAFASGAPNTLLKVELREDAGEPPPGVAIPVLALEPHWLASWASMVANGGRNVFGAAVFTRDLRSGLRPTAETADLTAEERVARFRAAASPQAYKLAGYLAAAPLSIPVIRLVQQAMLPSSTPADLAEIYLGELLRSVSQTSDPQAHEPAYEFHEGVREILMSGLRRNDAIRVLRNVWSVIRDRFGSPLDFPALLAEIERDGSGVPPDQAFAQVTAQVLERLGGRYATIARRINNTLKEQPHHAGAVPSGVDGRLVGPLPPRNPYFTGRDELLDSLRGSLDGKVTVLLPHPLHGLGGEGKSQLAVEYAHRFMDDYDLIWWIPADQMTVARSSLVNLARRLKTPESESTRGIVDNLMHALRTDPAHPRWLLIFDNARNPQDLLPALPVDGMAAEGEPLRVSLPSVSVLITSRDRSWEDVASATVSVDVFERPESIRYLRRRVPRLSDTEADQLAERVGDLPLAVEQAAAWQSTPGRTVEQYIELFDQLLLASPLEPLPENFPAHLAASLNLGLDRLHEENPQAGLLFEFWAFFSPEPVTVELLSSGRTADLPDPLNELFSDEASLRETMRLIDRFELARFDPEGDSLQVHRLVRTMLKTRIPAEERPRVRAQVHSILIAATPAIPADDETTWRRRSLVTPHVLASGIVNAATVEARNVALDQIQYLYLSGDFVGSRLIADFALTRWRNEHGPDDVLALDAARMLANALRALGETGAAAALSRDTLERAERKYEAGNLTVLFTALGYGADLKYLGQFEEAYDLDRLTWLHMTRRFGDDSAENTLVAAGNVSVGLRLLGRFHEAYEIDKDSLEALRRRPHLRYRDVFRATHHLARDLHGLGRYAEALNLQRESLGDLDPVLGPDHSLVLQAKMSHAGTLRESGLHEEAERLSVEVLESHVRRFGDEHPNTPAAKVCLAMALTRTGRLQKAQELQEETWTQLRRVLGDRHPFVHSCAAGLAIVLRSLGDVQTALEVDEWALNGLRTSPVGPDHYYSLFLEAGLSSDLYLLGRLDAAHRHSSRALQRAESRLGENHPVTLCLRHNHLLIGTAAGAPVNAEERPSARLAEILGKDHPSVLIARDGEVLDCVIEPLPL